MSISELVNKQKKAFRNGINRSAEARKKHLNRLKRVVKDHEKEFCDALFKDFGKPYADAYVTEVYVVLQEIDFHLKHIDGWMKPEGAGSILPTFPSKSYINKQPFGTVLVIAPWNYPFHLAMMPVIGALSAGNTVVLKPSEITSNTSSLINKLLAQEFSDALMAVVEGDADTAQKLLQQPFDKIFFTGSSHIGKIVMKIAAEQLIPVTLELGGKSPVIVHKDANADVAARRIWWGKTINAGQSCVAPDFALIHENLANAFVEESKKALELFFNGSIKTGENYTKIINQNNFDRLMKLLEDCDFLLDGRKDPEELLIEPVMVRAGWDDKIMQEEIFGPVLPMVTYSDEQAIIEKLQDRPSPLALYLFSDDQQFQKRIVDEVPFGGGCINDTMVHLGNPNLPFGGSGQSGMGSYHGKYSFETFSRKQSILKKPFWPDPDLRYPPYDESKITWFKRLFS